MSIHQAQMPLCQRDYCQLLIIDAQERLAAAMDPDELRAVVDNINRLSGAAKSVGVPVIATQHNSKGLGAIIGSIRANLPADSQPTEKTG